MDDNQEESGRGAVRVDASFNIDFKLLGDDKEEVSLEVFNHSTSNRLGIPPAGEGLPSELTDLQDYQNIPSALLKMWQSIDHKLDALMKIVGKEAHKLEGSTTGIIKNISSKGTKLKTGEKLEKGQFILMRISPPTFPSFTIDVVGEVITSDADETGGTRYHIEFSSINSDDVETLITYIFKRQREILRGRKDE